MLTRQDRRADLADRGIKELGHAQGTEGVVN